MKRRAALLALPTAGWALVASLAGCSSSSAAPAARVCTIAPPAPADWRLTADGTVLRDGLGRVVSLRGVDAGGQSKTAPFAPFDFTVGSDESYAQGLKSYMDRAATWGIDVLRVPFVWAAVEPAAGADDEAFLSRFDQLLDAAWARGIWTVVDFHQDVYAESFCGDGFPSWTLPQPAPAPHHDCPTWAEEYSTPAVEQAFDTFWSTGTVQSAYLALWDRMAARYKDRPGVIGFEPINEPSAGSADADTWEATTLTSFYSMMTGRLRAAAPTSLVFVDLSGIDGAFMLSKVGRPAGDGIVFAPHFYPFTSANDPTNVQPLMSTWSSIGAAWNVPTFVGEFGVHGDTDALVSYLTADYAAFDALGIGGAQWEYSVSATSWNNEGFSIVDADGTEHALVGPLARPYPRAVAAVAGTSFATAWDATARAFDLTYAPSDGVTEVSLPARPFPAGYDVALSGGCYDVTSSPGRMLVQPDAGARSVVLRVTAR